MEKTITFFCAIYFALTIITSCGDGSSERAEFEMKSYSTGIENHNTTIQFTDSSRLWIANYNNGLPSGMTDGNWYWVNKDSLIIKILMKQGVNSDNSGIYKFSDDYGCLRRKKCGKAYRQFCRKGGSVDGLDNWGDELGW